MRKHYKLLIVEDNEDEALLLQQAFADAGLPTVQIFNDATKVIEHLKGLIGKPTVLLLSWNLRARGAREICSWLARHPSIRAG
ncbi:MAG: hypothetical protein ACREIC_27810, partial [Limisphaerales bacterium]